MTTDAAEPGLRERKRLATRRAIQLAVLSLVAERGLANVTVDEISRVADVSPRTFFNYFTSKEEAIVGEAPTLPGEDAVESFVGAGPESDLFEGIGDMIAGGGTSESLDLDLLQKRRELMKLNPELFALRMATMKNFEEELGAIVSRRLALDEPRLAADPLELQQKSRLITLVAFAAMRHAWSSWADGGSSPLELGDRVRESFTQLRRLLVSEQGK
jgi:AcrR family transcriptional regulator